LKPAVTLMGITVGGLLLAACAGQNMTLPEDIQPVYKIRNSPLPVPDPKWKPTQRRAVKTATNIAKKPVKQRSAVPSRRSVARATVKRHIVRKGETLYALSKRYKVPVRALISNNKLRSPYTLSVGQRLVVPVTRVHTVKKGETGYGISRLYSVTASALMRANNIKPPYRLSVGQKLNLPGGAASNSAVASNQASNNNTQTRIQSKGRTIAMPTPPPRSRAGFEWPVAGKLASRFGPREGGLHNDGINIIAAKGTAVKVADAGVVVYASNALAGYGNLLLVKHAGGWITAYAHAERLLVRPGQKVKRGDIVARVGSTGGVSTAQLHFEIRKGRQAIDPLKYLPTTRSRAG